MRRSHILVVLLFASLFSPTAHAADGKPLTVVELFTAQGCAACPPADALLNELAARDDVLALSVHIDYWDYMGWPDPFASDDNTRRQRAYAEHFGLGYMYTPQMVIGGGVHVDGTDRDAVIRHLSTDLADQSVPVSIVAEQTTMVVSVGAADAPMGAAVVWLVTFDRERLTRVEYGDNSGRELRNVNVVRRFRQIGLWTGAPLTIPVAMPPRGNRPDACAVLIQAKDSGRIIGATRLQFPTN